MGILCSLLLLCVEFEEDLVITMYQVVHIWNGVDTDSKSVSESNLT